MIPGAFPIIAGATFNPQAASFNGSTYLRRSAGFSSISDGNSGTVSYWVRFASVGAQQTILSSGVNGGDVRFNVLIQASNRYGVSGVSTGNTVYLSAPYSPSLTASTGIWYHVLISWRTNGSSPTTRVYVNDAQIDSGGVGNGTIDYTQSQWNVGADVFNNARFLNGDLGELFFVPQFLDLTVTANRRKFVTAAGAPANLNSDGSAPFGTVPTVYLSGDAANFGTNRGNGGVLSVGAGSLTTASSRPHL